LEWNIAGLYNFLNWYYLAKPSKVKQKRKKKLIMLIATEKIKITINFYYENKWTNTTQLKTYNNLQLSKQTG